MPLQLRRGSTADRLATTPLVGEIVYDTVTKAVYVGDGTTVGGLPVTAFSIADSRTATAKMFLGDSLSDNSQHSGITFSLVGNRLNATVQQELSNYIGLIAADQGFKGNLWADDSGLIVNSETKQVYGNFIPEGHVIPDANETYDLGSATRRFRDLYLSGSSLYLGNARIVSTGTAIDFPTGSTIGGQPLGINEGDQYNIVVSGNIIGTDSTVLVNTANGTFNGDLYGSVFGFDSSILVDARDGVLRGTLIGSLTGDVTGNSTTATTAGVANTVALVNTNANSTHYVTFSNNTTGNESVRTDTNLTYNPSTNTLAAGTVSATSIAATSVTGNIFTTLIDSADSSAITVTPSVIFNSDVTVDNELYATRVFSNVTGDVLGNVTGNLTGNVLGNVTGVVTASAGSSLVGTVTGVVTASAGSSLVGTVTGNLTGDVLGNVTGNVLGNTTGAHTGSVTGNIFTTLIDSADSSAITVTPAIVFNSDVTIDNELLAGGHILPVNSESYDLGSYTKKFKKLYLTEGDNALWIGNATISGNGTAINLPAGSTVGGSAITTAAGSNATTITVNTTGTSADHFISFFDDQTGDNLIYTDDTFKYNPGTGVLTVGDAIIGSVTGNLIGNVTGTVSGNAGSVTDGVYTTGDQTIGGSKTFSSTILGNLTGNVTGDLTGLSVQSNSVSVGSNTNNGLLTVRTPSNAINMASLIIAHATAANTSNFGFNRSRGTPSAPTTVLSGDRLGDIRFNGHNGSSYFNSVFLRAEAAGVSGGNVAGRFRILTTDLSGTVNVGLTVDGAADVYVSNNLYVTRTATVGSITIDNNKITSSETNADIELDPNGTGTVDFQILEQTTVGAAGAASALPATPSTYFKIKVNGVEYVVPAYAVA
jgi:hypothetical protein